MRTLGIILFATILVVQASTSSAGTLEEGYRAVEQGNYELALKIWQPLAESGDPQAQYYIGWLYVNGFGVPQDYRKAEEYWILAAAGGSAEAKTDLEKLYIDQPALVSSAGQEIPSSDSILAQAEDAFQRGDYSTALQLLKPLADQGDTYAQLNLGMMYYNGNGTPKNYAEAERYWLLSAAQGNEIARDQLKLIYATPSSPPQPAVSTPPENNTDDDVDTNCPPNSANPSKVRCHRPTA